MCAIGRSNGFGRAVHVVAATTTVRMNIDKSWAYVAVTRIHDYCVKGQIHRALATNGNNSFVFDNDNAMWQHFSRKYHVAPK
jgi:hypothetical protein